MALWYSHYTRRATKGLACLGATIFLLHKFGVLDFSSRPYDTWTWVTCPGSSPFEQSCTTSRATTAQDVLIVVKTGGSEPQTRLRSQLATVLSRIPRQNIIIFSDMEEQIDSYDVHDVYASLPEQERANYPEFTLYNAQQKYQRQGRDTRLLEGGWNLAK